MQDRQTTLQDEIDTGLEHPDVSDREVAAKIARKKELDLWLGRVEKLVDRIDASESELSEIGMSREGHPATSFLQFSEDIQDEGGSPE